MTGASVMAAGRDTDADWREIGRAQPFWGVITQPEYRTENLTPARVDDFYATGVADMAEMVGRIEAATGARPGGRALDFGCGTGRLAEAMTAYADEVTGYDISPDMLARARARGGRATYVDQLPDGPFDWINSYIVFQHIAPARGLRLIEQLLARLAPRGVASLQLTIWREAQLAPATPAGWRRLAQPLLAWLLGPRPPRGTILMHDYDLSAVVRLFHLAGVGPLTLVPTDHGGHHGVVILGRKAP